MTDDTGFLIEGRRYELPDMGTFTVRESKVFFDQTGLVPEVVRMRLADGSLTYMELLENIGFVPALATIAYRRENTDSTDADVELVIGNTARDDLFMALLDQPDEEEVPPSGGVTSDQPGSSPNGSSEPTPTSEPSKSISGQSSTPSSGKQDGPSESTGTIGSGSWPTLAPERLVS